jgi:hypothetical protein
MIFKMEYNPYARILFILTCHPRTEVNARQARPGGTPLAEAENLVSPSAR